MVVGAFPIAKLGALLLRQVSKPIANFVSERAKKNLFFRTYICMPPAQIYHWCEVKSKMWVMGLGKTSNVPALNEAMAIQLGANLLGEGIIFFIAASVLYMEYMRSSRKETVKEEGRVDELNTLHYTIQELYFTTERQDAQIRELNRMVVDLENRVVSKPWVRPKKDDPLATDPVPTIEQDPCPPKRNGIVLQAIDYFQNDVMHKR